VSNSLRPGYKPEIHLHFREMAAGTRVHFRAGLSSGDKLLLSIAMALCTLVGLLLALIPESAFMKDFLELHHFWWLIFLFAMFSFGIAVASFQVQARNAIRQIKLALKNTSEE
jgi:hypothetical protein